MAKFTISGGNKLYGDVSISGAKNAAIKMIAAAILGTEIVVLKNMPRLSDVNLMIKLVEGFGVKTRWLGKNVLELDCTKVEPAIPDPKLVKKLRASILLIGPALARFGNIKIATPGGDHIGKRPISTHLDAVKKMGAQINLLNQGYSITAEKLTGNTIFLKEMSVTATENTMMAAVLAKGKTIIEVAASEPEIANLAMLLNKMGAKIKGAGTPTIEIEGVKKLSGATIEIIPDRIEAGTLLLAGLVTRGQVTVTNVLPNHLANFLSRLEDLGATVTLQPSSITISAPNKLKPIYVDTRPYPGFSTDLQSPLAVVLTQANGKSRIFETLFENRFNYVPTLQKMGAKIKVANQNILEINGPTTLKSGHMHCHDIRDSAALVLAGLIAKGTSVVENIEIIDRGYEQIEEKLQKLGAKIKRVP